MKKKGPGLALVFLVVAGGLLLAAEGPLTVSFSDALWDGVKVPEGQQCQRFGGSGQSPSLEVKGIPAGANALVVEFSDRTYQPMDGGGHGKIGFAIEPGTESVTVPPVPGHTDQLPEGFFVVELHKAPNWDKAGAYLPPCSGGRGNSYYLTVKAVHRMGEEIHPMAEADLEMGKF